MRMSCKFNIKNEGFLTKRKISYWKVSGIVTNTFLGPISGKNIESWIEFLKPYLWEINPDLKCKIQSPSILSFFNNFLAHKNIALKT